MNSPGPEFYICGSKMYNFSVLLHYCRRSTCDANRGQRDITVRHVWKGHWRNSIFFCYMWALLTHSLESCCFYGKRSHSWIAHLKTSPHLFHKSKQNRLAAIKENLMCTYTEFVLTYGGLWRSLWYEHILSCWTLFLSTISVPAEKETEELSRFLSDNGAVTRACRSDSRNWFKSQAGLCLTEEFTCKRKCSLVLQEIKIALFVV